MIYYDFFILPTPKTRCILLLVAILSSPGKENSRLKNKCEAQTSKMTILDCVFVGRIHGSKILHELWAFMQTHPSPHILY